MERTAYNTDANKNFLPLPKSCILDKFISKHTMLLSLLSVSCNKTSEEKRFMPIFWMKYWRDMNKMEKILLENICTYFYTYFLKWMINFFMLIYLQIFREEQSFFMAFYLSFQRIVQCMQLKAHFLCLELTSLIWMQLMG